jgi:hypothetical protein
LFSALAQSQDVDQTLAPMAHAPSSPSSLSFQSKNTAEGRSDAIEQPGSVTNASTLDVKDNATVTVDGLDPLNYGRYRRENISQKQMKADHPLAKPRHMKVCWQLVLAIDEADRM